MADESSVSTSTPAPAETREMMVGGRAVTLSPEALAKWRSPPKSERELIAETEARASGATPPAKPKPEPKPAPKQAPPPAAAKPESNAFERAAAREAQRNEAAQAREQAAQIESYARAIQPDAQNWRAIQQAHARGDFDAVASLLGAKSWGDVQDHYVRSLTDPGHARVLELERRLADREAREQRAEQERAAQVQTHQQAAAIHAYKARMAEQAKSSAHPVLRTFADAPDFVEALFEARQAHYQRTGEELALEQALDVRRPTTGISITEEIERLARTADRYRSARKPSSETEAPAARKPKPAARGVTRADERDEQKAARAWESNGAKRLAEAFKSDSRFRTSR